VIDRDRAHRLAEDWLAAWNAHDLDAVMSHYVSDIEFISPFVVELSGRADGTLRGADELRAYFASALEAFPDLRFADLRVAVGVSSVTLVYRSVRDLVAAETMFLGEDGKVVRVLAHYAAG
jgi:ketosteroid isomerase-like protein